MILQFGQSCLALFSKLGRSWDSYRAVLDSGSSSAMEPDLLPPPLLEPPPLSLLEPHPAAIAAAAARAPSAHTGLNFTGTPLIGDEGSSADGLSHPSGERPVGLTHDEDERAEQLGAI